MSTLVGLIVGALLVTAAFGARCAVLGAFVGALVGAIIERRSQ